ncbi:MAG: extracellular solute-binding protein, partial [Lachnospiraceae bacterium]|nr:extracellular solute-binding protein [Lachnospiraceae bacterium]
MKKKRERKQKIALAVIIVLIAVIAIIISNNKNKSDAELRASILAQEWDYSDELPTAYSTYLASLKTSGKIVKGSAEVEVSAKDYKSAVPEDCFEVTTEGVLTYKGGTIEYNVKVPSAGTYYIEVGYLPVADGNLTILRNLLVNGKSPFDEAKGITFDRMWVDESKDFLMKTDENQGFPTQVQDPDWTSVQLESADRSTTGPFLFYFNKGNNTIAFTAEQATLGISYIKLVPAEELITYEVYSESHANAKKIDAAEIGTDGRVTVQAEDTSYKSSAVLLPQNDRTSSVTVPQHSSNIVLNTIGGATWNQAGLGITWEIDVPETGLYRIATRFMQAENRDFYSARELKINGEVPFLEAADLRFYYDSGFQVDFLGNDEGAYYFYLEKGTNTLTMTVTLGELAYAVEQTKISVYNFNDLLRRITAITTSTPDTYRDYAITTSIPDMVDIMSKEYVRLTKVMESFGDSLESTTKTSEIAKFLLQLETLIEKPDRIAKEYNNFSTNISAVSSWMLQLDEQPLQLDYICLVGEGAKLPKAEGNIFQNLAHGIAGFVGSFTNDYRVKTDANDDAEKNIVVWIATSTRDQYDVAQRMINNAFKDSNYTVELKMVGAGVIMKSTLTGNGPDVAIQLDYSIPTNFAFRGAGYDLSQFDDFDEIVKRFAPGAMEYFEYQGGYYALPDEMSFPVMFYRTDILKELGLEVPNTWDDVIDILPYLQSENMSIFFPYGSGSLGGATSTSSKPISTFFASRLYQNGIELYRDGGAYTNLDTLEAGLTFKELTEYYTKQSFQLAVDTTTRFRRGEVPIFIGDYTGINSLKAAAPEIEGAWDIAPIPGTLKEDGSIDRSTACMVGSCMIIKTSVEQNDTLEEAWEFLKWWTSAETQKEYANGQIAILGDAAEFPIANVEAIMERAEEKGTSETLEEVIKWLRGVPQVPGAYITGREVENAFLETVSDVLNPVDTLYSKLQRINNEL